MTLALRNHPGLCPASHCLVLGLVIDPDKDFISKRIGSIRRTGADRGKDPRIACLQGRCARSARQRLELRQSSCAWSSAYAWFWASSFGSSASSWSLTKSMWKSKRGFPIIGSFVHSQLSYPSTFWCVSCGCRYPRAYRNTKFPLFMTLLASQLPKTATSPIPQVNHLDAGISFIGLKHYDVAWPRPPAGARSSCCWHWSWGIFASKSTTSAKSCFSVTNCLGIFMRLPS